MSPQQLRRGRPRVRRKGGRADIQVRSSRRHAGLDAGRRLQSDARSRAAEWGVFLPRVSHDGGIRYLDTDPIRT